MRAVPEAELCRSDGRCGRPGTTDLGPPSRRVRVPGRGGVGVGRRGLCLTLPAGHVLRSVRARSNRWWQQIGNTRAVNSPIEPTSPHHEKRVCSAVSSISNYFRSSSDGSPSAGFRSDSVTQWSGVMLSAESPQDVRQRPSADHDHQRISAGQPACANICHLQSLSLTYKETKK